MSDKDPKRGLGQDIFYQAPGVPIKRSKGGRPKRSTQRLVKASFWVREQQLVDLEELKNEDRSRLQKAGKKDWRQVSVTSLVVAAIDEYLTRRRRKS
jgi:hypothetical protein